MTRATGSRLDLLAHCQHWAQDSAPWTDSEAGEAAREGSAFHGVAEMVIRGDLTQWSPQIASRCTEMAAFFGVDAANLTAKVATWIREWGVRGYQRSPGDRVECEVSFAWDPATGRVRRCEPGARDQRQIHPGEVVCTVDLLAMSEDGRVTVGDHKTGGVYPAEGARQLLFGALCVVRLAEQEGRRVGAISTEFYQVAEDGSLAVDTADVDGLGLAMFEAELKGLVAVASPDPQPGPHCSEHWCPMMTSCRATREAAADIVPVAALLRIPDREPVQMAITTPADLERWLLVKKQAEAILDELDRQAKLLVEQSPDQRVELSGGKSYRIIRYTKSGFNKARAVELLGDRAEECTTETVVTQFRVVGGEKKPRAKSHAAE